VNASSGRVCTLHARYDLVAVTIGSRAPWWACRIMLQ